MRRIATLSVLVGLVMVLVGCGRGDTADDDPTTSAAPATATTIAPAKTTISPAAASTTAATTTTDLSKFTVAGLTAHAIEFSDAYHRSWPDIDLALERFTNNAVFYDPADGDFIIEGKAVVPMLRGVAAYMAGVEPVMEEVFVSADGASFRALYGHGYWPPWSVEPADHPPVVGLDVFHFEGDAVTGLDIWFEDGTLGMLGFGCFAANGCPQLATIVDGYVTAWTSGDPSQIAALYDDNTAFTDSLLQIDAVGPEEISGIAEARFGEGDVTLEVVEIYAQTNGPDVPTDTDSEIGEVIAVGLHYRISSQSADFTSFESLTTFEFGTRQANGFTPHPEGLITHEEVFHKSDSLATVIPWPPISGWVG
jgi:hypothetical protein